MSTHILGAGSMGCLWAAYLALSSSSKQQASADGSISFVSTRPLSPTSICFTFDTPFVELSSQNPRLTFPVLHSPTAKDSIKCLLVCTKSYDALPALKEVSQALSPETIIVLFQNGLGSQFQILEHFPDNPVFAAVTTEGANRPNPVTVIHAGRGLTKVGALNALARDNKALNTLKNSLKLPTLSSYLKVEFVNDIWQALWQKLVINCAINPYTAQLNCPNGLVRSNTLFDDTWPELKKELLQLLKLAGYPMSDKALEELVFDVMNKTASNISSMLQDVRNKRKTEIEDINGFAFSYLKQNNAPHALNQKLLEAIVDL